MSTTTIAVIIFVAAYALIISEKVHRTIVGIFGAMLMILCGVIDQQTAIGHIDFNTLGLLIGMMIIVNITSETGLFNFLAIWAAKKVKARPIALLVALSALTMVCSALLDNVTTVLRRSSRSMSSRTSYRRSSPRTSAARRRSSAIRRTS